jgi:hypothetical protein
MSNRDGPRHWLGIYLNDHLAGATAGAELARRVAGSHQDPRRRKRLAGLAEDIAADRQALLQLMRGAGVPVRGRKILAGRAAEKATRLNPSASCLTRSPLSELVELETLAVVEELRIQVGVGLFSPG